MNIVLESIWCGHEAGTVLEVDPSVSSALTARGLARPALEADGKPTATLDLAEGDPDKPDDIEPVDITPKRQDPRKKTATAKAAR